MPPPPRLPTAVALGRRWGRACLRPNPLCAKDPSNLLRYGGSDAPSRGPLEPPAHPYAGGPVDSDEGALTASLGGPHPHPCAPKAGKARRLHVRAPRARQSARHTRRALSRPTAALRPLRPPSPPARPARWPWGAGALFAPRARVLTPRPAARARVASAARRRSRPGIRQKGRGARVSSAAEGPAARPPRPSPARPHRRWGPESKVGGPNRESPATVSRPGALAPPPPPPSPRVPPASGSPSGEVGGRHRLGGRQRELRGSAPPARSGPGPRRARRVGAAADVWTFGITVVRTGRRGD